MYIYLDFVEDFACEMCGSCCRNDWMVTLDEVSYRRNQHLFRKTQREGEFQQAFTPLVGKTSPGEYAYITKQADGGCWFLSQDNSCRLHKEAGHEHLDSVCQTFPRYPIDTARGIELTLSLNCPAVLKMVSRVKPLEIIRSEQRPIAFDDNNCVAAVFPKQHNIASPLRYYFELEHHFIDIMQWRGLSVRERLALLADTIAKIDSITSDVGFSQNLNVIINQNYELLDSMNGIDQPIFEGAPEILIENFFINYIFKKPFYLYGLQPTMELLLTIWQYIEEARSGSVDQGADLERTAAAIMNVELRYSHNRQGLLQEIQVK